MVFTCVGALAPTPEHPQAAAGGWRGIQLGTDGSEAIPLLEKASSLNPNEPSNYFLLAKALKLCGRITESNQALGHFGELKLKHFGESPAMPRQDAKRPEPITEEEK